MTGSGKMLISRVWFLIIVVLIATNLILFSFRLAAADPLGGTNSGLASASNELDGAASRLDVAANSFKKGMVLTGHTINRDVAAFISDGGRTVENAFQSVRSVSLGTFIRPAVRIRPAIIIPVASAMPAPATGQPVQTGPVAQWPIHGAITTPFGVPELPYELIHTGLDISDGQAPGATPIRPFKPGVIVSVIRSGGLGNHVIVDHGGGVTSVYGHLYSIAVRVGQQVGENTVLGYEGSTGISTGTHLHFEIRLNGQPVDPHKFIGGQP